MRKFGISVYPNHTSNKECVEYIEMAGSLGAKRIFTCLLSASGTREETIVEFSEMTKAAKRNNMEVIVDVAPSVFKHLNITYTNLSFFKEIGVDGFRLDEGFTGLEEAAMTFNEHNLKVEVNMSNTSKFLDNIMSYQPKRDFLIGCHNFYPLPYSGLDRKLFDQTSRDFKTHNLETTAFVSSTKGMIGPWKVVDGLCTLEEHRHLSLDTAAKELWNTNLIDNVLIGNQAASEDELKSLSNVDPYKLEFLVESSKMITKLDKTIVFDEFHFNRGDQSSYLIRSTQSRVKYASFEFPNYNVKDIKKGDILIGNDTNKRYAGELSIALKDIKNDGSKNIVGKVIDREQFLLDKLEPWQKFGFKPYKQ